MSDTVLKLHIAYTVIPTTFIKRDLRPSERGISPKTGQLITRPWVEERLHNKAAALKLISDRTTIPVPKLIACGKDDEGLAYLEIERIFGIVGQDVGKECHMPEEQVYNNGGPCDVCVEIAKANAKRFVTTMVRPKSLYKEELRADAGLIEIRCFCSLTS